MTNNVFLQWTKQDDINQEIRATHCSVHQYIQVQLILTIKLKVIKLKDCLLEKKSKKKYEKLMKNDDYSMKKHKGMRKPWLNNSFVYNLMYLVSENVNIMSDISWWNITIRCRINFFLMINLFTYVNLSVRKKIYCL